MIKKILAVFFFITLLACKQPVENKATSKLNYFDVKGYFNKEAARLTKLRPSVWKEVSVNQEKERKIIRISDWQQELAIFVDADINKASWKGNFKVVKTPDSELYTALNEKIPVKRVLIRKENNQVKGLEILIASKNILYTSQDTLLYYPGDRYRISKRQKIKLLNTKRYGIIAKFRS